MKKQLLSTLCLAAALLPAFNANAEEAITEKWLTPFIADYAGKWTAGVTWTDGMGTMGTANPRFATALDGKIYTVDQARQCIAEVTAEGLELVYELPEPADNKQYYGTAITVDEAGNFLVGMDFTARPGSSLNWTVYNPKDGSAKQLILNTPEGWVIGRTDCVGRVLGDLTKEAYFFITPETGAYTAKVRIIKATGDGTVASIAFEDAGSADVVAYSQQNIAQPVYATLAEAKANGGEKDFYYASVPPATGKDSYYALYQGGEVKADFMPDMKLTTFSGFNGFNTFVVDGKRYFIRDLSIVPGARKMAVVVTDDKGDAVAEWSVNPSSFTENGGYSSIMVKVLENKTVDIYYYASNNVGGAAAILNFDPAKAHEPVIPEEPAGTIDNPIRIKDVTSLVSLAGKLQANSTNYVVLEADLDMTGIPFEPIKLPGYSPVIFDGQNHIITDLAYTASGSTDTGLFASFEGEIKNLGLVDVSFFSNWGCCGAFAGTAHNTTVTNCFASGTTTAAAVGGFFGTVFSGTVTITDSYSQVNVNDPNNHFAGGLVGRLGGNGNSDAVRGGMTAKNCYVSGNIIAKGAAAGIASLNTNTALECTAENVVIWSKVINGSSAQLTFNQPAKADAEAPDFAPTESGIESSVDTKMNDQVVPGGKTNAALREIVTAWPAYNKTIHNGYPVLAWQKANGNESETPTIIGDREDNPYVIKTPQDLIKMQKYITGEEFYAELANDIDMAGYSYKPVETKASITFKGNYHVIKNLTASSAYAALFNEFIGDIGYVGLENMNMTATDKWGVGGGLVGYIAGSAYIHDCYTTGKSNGFYAGGLIGGIRDLQEVTVERCYSSADVTSSNGFAGGLVGPSNTGSSTTILNCYSSGNVNGAVAAAGVVLGLNPNLAKEEKSATIYVDQAVAWNKSIKSNYNEEAAAFNPAGAITLGLGTEAPTVENSLVCVSTLINDNPVEGAAAIADVQATVTAWDGFNDKLNNGYGVLAWQEANGEGSTGISDIIADGADNDAPAVYYNLQGVRVANPSNGIYIVRQGNKASKVYVK
ncbi:MAG: hypothetical protein J6B44_06860 [Muribaculaceae bacterium]|nr:hypothetical protein [Muribaculaceae bacterium]